MGKTIFSANANSVTYNAPVSASTSTPKYAFTLTESHIHKSTSYIPLATKKAIAKTAAKLCVETVNDSDATIPPLYIEDTASKPLVLCGMLVKQYLHAMEKDSDNDFIITSKEYDMFYGSHLMNQIERMKTLSAFDIKNQIYDLLYDYRDFEKKLNVEIHNLLKELNDPTMRIMKMMEMQTTPEAIAKATEELQKVAAQANSYEMKSLLPENEFQEHLKTLDD